MPNIPFPNVPQAAGVPAVPRSGSKVSGAARVALGALQGALWRAFQVDSRWGIFDKKGKNAFDPSKVSGITGSALEALGLGSTLSTSSVDFSAESKVADFPVEQGSFASFNKVEQPYACKVCLSFQGTEADRKKFLARLEAARTSTELFDVATPEATFTDCTVDGYNYQRTSQNGTTLLRVEINLRKIRQVTAQYGHSNKGAVDAPKDPAATPPADGGKVQAQAPKQSTLKALADKVPNAVGTVKKYLGQ